MATETTVAPPQRTDESEDSREETRAPDIYVIPPVDIFEDEEGLIVLADMPGVEPSALEVRLEKGVLTMQGKARHIAPGTPFHREFELTGFFRQFRLSDDIDENNVDAELRNGVLRIRLRRAPSAQPRRIEVRAS